MKVYKETEGGPFDDGPGLEFKKSARIYNKKLRALKEKYNIKDIPNSEKEWMYLFENYELCKIAVKNTLLMFRKLQTAMILKEKTK